MIDRAELQAGVREALVETLGIEPEEATPGARFRDDLGGESIDDLDLGFRLDQKFGIKSNFLELAPHWKPDENGQLASASIEAIHQSWPFLTPEDLQLLEETSDFYSVFTVDFVERLVAFRMQQQSENAAVGKAS